MVEEVNIEILNKTKGKLMGLPFGKIKNYVLGDKYNLSLVFIGERRSRKLNLKYRQKDKAGNVLSFPLDKNNGEIFICPQKAKKEYKNFDMNFNDFITYLFIHGLLHLKGMEHSSKMEEAEKKIMRFFGIN